MFKKVKKYIEKRKLIRKFSDCILSDFKYIPSGDKRQDANFNNYYTNITLDKPLVCTSQLCNQEFFGLPLFQYWANKIIDYWNDYIIKAKKQNPHNMPQGILLHRKLWEFVYIIQTLYENDCLKEGKKGLGFGVGTEPLPALFASMGCEILGTDLDINDVQAKAWADNNQNTKNDVNILNAFNICPDDIFKKNVKYRSVNMNEIPDDLNEQFDFNWSSCALEHIGGLDKSLDFLINNLKTLKSGGIAVHTTEFNLSSNKDTLLDPYCTILRKQDIENIIKKLENLGHFVYPINFKIGNYVADNYVDIPPYYQNNMHLRLNLDKYVTTSIGLIIRKK